jgi:hypothetical protein
VHCRRGGGGRPGPRRLRRAGGRARAVSLLDRLAHRAGDGDWIGKAAHRRAARAPGAAAGWHLTPIALDTRSERDFCRACTHSERRWSRARADAA